MAIALKPTKVFLGATAVVGASTALLPFVTGYGTVLSQLVVLGAWSIVAKIKTQEFADLHHAPVWGIAFFLNLIGFLVPSVVIWLVTSHRWPRAGSSIIAAWAFLYLASLFVLFPATDGP